MKRAWLYSCIFLPCLLWGQCPYSLVFVHIGRTLPPYLEIALKQARLFNQECPLVLIANKEALESFNLDLDVQVVSCESLPQTTEHQEFLQRTKFSDQVFFGYKRYTSERFLYLYDYMKAFEVKNVFHLENDVMLYVDLQEIFSIFQRHYPGMGATFESESKCIPGFVFIADKRALQKLARHFVVNASKGVLDMQILASFGKNCKEEIDCLPMIMDSYLQDHFQGACLEKRKSHSKHIDEFGSIFDGASIGVFFDGLSADKGNFPPGYLMKKLFNPSLLDYKWEEDELGRKIPYAVYRGKSYKINNLHIASKRLERFTSWNGKWRLTASLPCD